MHLYPIGGDVITSRLDAIGELARKRGKSLVCGEAWLYKAGRGEMGGGVANAPGLFQRDVYSFWSPLDARFFRAVATQVERNGFLFCNFFWVRYLFGMIDYGPETAGLKPAVAFQQANQRAGQAMLRGELSPLGKAMQSMLAERSSRRRP
ncbi:MAG: hypothetical protein Q7S40_24410 [Opitutaceae bacterium]|nr:hypothetical protein [Opitutaceae bacterium]